MSRLFTNTSGAIDDEINTALKSIASQYHKKNELWSKLINVFSKNYSYNIKKEYEIIINKRIAKIDKLLKYFNDEINKLINANKGYYDQAVKNIYEEERKFIYALSHIDGNPSILDLQKMSLLEVIGINEDTKEYINRKRNE